MAHQIATFYLDTNYADISDGNATWNNINLRLLLGDMWNKHELFNLYLIEYATGKCQDITDKDALSITVFMSGPPFVNSGYDTRTNRKINKTLLTTIQFVSGDVTSKVCNGLNKLTFSKNQQQLSFTLQYGKVADYEAKLDVDDYPDVVFMFGIEGVHVDKDTNVAQRMTIH